MVNDNVSSAPNMVECVLLDSNGKRDVKVGLLHYLSHHLYGQTVTGIWKGIVIGVDVGLGVL